MTSNIDFSKVVSFSDLTPAMQEEIAPWLDEASSYISGFKWCGGVERAFLGLFYHGILAVFLFRITPAIDGVDVWLWVVVGDLPPAYLVCDECPNPACALDGYVAEMRKWAVAANKGETVERLIPVDVQPTQENAQMLAARLDYIEKRLLMNLHDDIY